MSVIAAMILLGAYFLGLFAFGMFWTRREVRHAGGQATGAGRPAPEQQLTSMGT